MLSSLGTWVERRQGEGGRGTRRQSRGGRGGGHRRCGCDGGGNENQGTRAASSAQIVASRACWGRGSGAERQLVGGGHARWTGHGRSRARRASGGMVVPGVYTIDLIDSRDRDFNCWFD
jgi:hypothetical protein